MIVGLVMLGLLIAQISAAKVPYVELGPGPTYNTLGTDGGHDVIEVSGAGTSASAGQLRMVTVNVISNLTLWDALRGWVQPQYAVVPRELIYPPDRSEQQVEQQNAEDFKQSQSSAETAALRVLGYPVRVTVKSVVSGAPAQDRLRAGDVIDTVDGTRVTSAGQLVELIQGKPAGTALSIGYTRDGDRGTTSIRTAAGEDGKPRIGVVPDQLQPHPFTVKFELEKVGGPSAGLMFALGIVDKLEPADLTGGVVIAGTGTIDDDGKVGPIGGVAQKLIGAHAAHARYFLTPADNCADATANPQPGLTLVKVSNLDGALSALADIRAHRTPPLCPGG
jgi:PDZ domain-containing protein